MKKFTSLPLFLLLPSLLMAIGMPTVQDIMSIGNKFKQANALLKNQIKNQIKNQNNSALFPHSLKPYAIPGTALFIDIPKNWKKRIPKNNNIVGVFAPKESFYPSLIMTEIDSEGQSLYQYQVSWVMKHRNVNLQTNSFQLLTINHIPIGYADVIWQILPNYYIRAMIVTTMLTPSKILSISYMDAQNKFSAYIKNQYMSSLSSLKYAPGTNNE